MDDSQNHNMDNVWDARSKQDDLMKSMAETLHEQRGGMGGVIVVSVDGHSGEVNSVFIGSPAVLPIMADKVNEVFSEEVEQCVNG